MKKKKIPILLATMIIITSVMGNASSVFAKENKKFSLTKDNFKTMDLVKYVNPLIGTDNFKGNSEWAGTAPLVSAPFGMTNFTPQTRQNRIGDISYMYRDTKFKGFFATHQPAIWMGDYGYVNVMPQIGDIKPDENGRALSFSHDDEVSTPYYYKVKAGEKENKPITAEMTATERCAIYNFTYPDTNEAKIFVESARDRGNGQIEIDEKNGEISGWNNDNMSSHLNNNPPKNLKGYFVIQFTKPISGKGTYKNYEIKKDEVKAEGQKSGAYISFDANVDEKVEVRIGTSFVSVEQARANIEQELDNKTFDQVKDSSKEVWNDRLNTIQIKGATEDENYIFYTAMYHALLYPRSFYETVNGEDTYFSPYDDKYHKGKSYTDFSLWDTFRAQNSLLTLVAPDKIDDMVSSLLQTYQEGGYMPKWPNPGYSNIMIGSHADSIVAEAINKGFKGFDYNLAYEAVLKDAMVPQEGDGTIYKWGDRNNNVPYEARGGLSAYKALGYIPNGYVNENVSRTIEFAYDDWCVAQVAKKLGKDDEAKFFLNRSMNYKNAISPDTGYAMGRDLDGNWTTSGEQFTEGDRRKYTWFAPHDPQGLLNYMTENQNADFYNNELEKAFGGLGGEKWIEHQNEPCHNYAYMFDFSGRPDLTQKYARQTLLESYSNTPSGELGNDDCGQMSAWYVFSAIGFYPANPASGEYMIGSPIFDEVKINNRRTNKQFVITANNNNDQDNKNCYIQDARFNGQNFNVPYITYDQIMEGGEVVFNMSDQPSDWAKDYRKEAIQYDKTAQGPKDDSKPPFFGDGKVNRVTGINYAKDAKVSATDYADPKGDIDVPSKSLIDGNYDKGYASKNIKSNADLAKSPYYITMEWDNPLSKVTSFKMWSNYKGSQNPTKMDIETKDSSGQWKVIESDWTPEWQNESGGDNRCSANIKFGDELNDIKGIRVRIKEGNFNWGKIAVRELEVFEDYSEKVNVNNPSDYIANITYNGNKLQKILFKGKELKEGTDYKLSGNNNSQINIFGKTLVANGADSGAKLEFVFSQGKSYSETLVIWESWKANLESLIEKAEAANDSMYTTKSLELLKPLLKEANDLLDKLDATDTNYETMSIKLQDGLKKLVLLVDSKQRIEFENANSCDSSVKFEERDGGIVAGYTAKGSWFQYDGVKFDKTMPDKVSVRYAAANSCVANAVLEIRLGDKDGELITSIATPPTGDWSKFVTVSANIKKEAAKKLDGSQPICFVLNGDSGSYGNLNWVLFEKEVTVDKTELDKVIKESEKLNSSKYTEESWNTMKKALSTAKTCLENESATQDEVNKALSKLKEACNHLVLLGDKAELNKVIKEIEKLDKSKYTSESWDNMMKVLEKAKKVMDNKNATQADVNNVLKELQAIKEELKSIDEQPIIDVKPEEKPGSDTESGESSQGSVKTGDIYPIYLMVTLLGLSAVTYSYLRRRD